MKISKENYDKLVEKVGALEKAINGGKGSGNFGHSGRPGYVGGSGDGIGVTSDGASKPYSKMTRDELKAEVEKRGLELDGYKSDKDSLISRIEKYDTYQKNIDDSRAEVDKLGLSDEQKNLLNKPYDGYLHDDVIVSEGQTHDGVFTHYNRNQAGYLTETTYGIGDSAYKVSRGFTPLQSIAISEAMSDTGYSLTQTEASRIYEGGKWRKAGYSEDYSTVKRGEYDKTVSNLKVGESAYFNTFHLYTVDDKVRVSTDGGRVYTRIEGSGSDRSNFADYSIGLTNNGKDYGVNWGAWGTQPTEKTKLFADGLKKASEYADQTTSLINTLRDRLK